MRKDELPIKPPPLRGKPFQPGNSYGKGRPPGSRNKATLALQELLDGEGELILRKAIELAKGGNDRAQKLCLERLMPPCRERTVRLALPIKCTTAADICHALNVILTGVAQGEITPGEAVQLANIVEVRRKAMETEEFEQRLKALEDKQEGH
jgi:hypothetical protein